MTTGNVSVIKNLLTKKVHEPDGFTCNLPSI